MKTTRITEVFSEEPKEVLQVVVVISMAERIKEEAQKRGLPVSTYMRMILIEYFSQVD